MQAGDRRCRHRQGAVFRVDSAACARAAAGGAGLLLDQGRSSQIAEHWLEAANQGVSPADVRKSVFPTVRVTALPAHEANCRVRFDLWKVI